MIYVGVGGQLTTQGVEIRGTGQSDTGGLVIVEGTQNNVPRGTPSQWLNTGDMTIGDEGRFHVADGARAESHGLDDAVASGIALGFQTNFGLYGNVSYDLEIGRESELNHTLAVGVDWKF